MNPTHGLRHRILQGMATAVHSMAWPIIIFGILLAGLSIYLACTRLKISGNPNDLLRSDSSFHKLYLEYTRQFRAEEDYVIVVHSPDFQRNKKCVESMVASIKSDPRQFQKALSIQPEFFNKILYKIDLNASIKERGMLYLEIPQLLEIDGKIAEFSSLMGKEKLSLDLNSLLEVASTKFDPKYMRKKENEAGVDAFAQEFVTSLNQLADRLEGKAGKQAPQFGNFLSDNSDLKDMERTMEENEYISFDGGKILLINVPSPNLEASFGDHSYIVDPLKKIIEDARVQFPGMKIGLTGEPALSEDQAQATTRDSTLSSIATFILIVLLFWFAYRDFSRPSLALLTLVVAVCWTMGFTTLFVGRLNILTLAFIPMILGLGIDFGIQILGRYEEELPKAGDVIAAITQTLLHTGNAILIGASTTAAAFYTMCLNEFSGLSEMGVIGGTGILLCTLGSLIFLPALLAIRDQKIDPSTAPIPEPQTTKVHWVDQIVQQRSWGIIAVAAIITGLAISQIPKIRFDYNLLNLQNNKLESVHFERILLNTSDSRSVLCAAVIADDMKQAEEFAARAKKLTSVVREVISVTEMVPHDQDEKLKIISRIKNRLENVRLPKSDVKVNVPQNIKILQTLRANCARMQRLAKSFGSKQQATEAEAFFSNLILPMDRALKILQSMNQEKAEQILTSYQTQLFRELRKNLSWLKMQKVDRPITLEDVPANLRDRYVGKNGKILIEIYPKEDIWERDPLARFVDKLKLVSPNVTGTPVQNYHYIELLRLSYEKAAYYALIAIVFIITFHFRTLKYVFPTLLPLGLAVIWSAGLMPLLNLPFNPANIITLPLLIGIGVAYGVYAVDRYRENRSPALFSTSTGKAILLSALTTIFGFGTLAFASDPSLASLGLLMSIGILMCLITSLYVCTAVLQVLGRRQLAIEGDEGLQSPPSSNPKKKIFPLEK